MKCRRRGSTGSVSPGERHTIVAGELFQMSKTEGY
jgi:hypothetical protein